MFFEKFAFRVIQKYCDRLSEKHTFSFCILFYFVLAQCLLFLFSLEYLADLQGRGFNDPGLYWDFYGSSVCGK